MGESESLPHRIDNKNEAIVSVCSGAESKATGYASDEQTITSICTQSGVPAANGPTEAYPVVLDVLKKPFPGETPPSSGKGTTTGFLWCGL